MYRYLIVTPKSKYLFNSFTEASVKVEALQTLGICFLFYKLTPLGCFFNVKNGGDQKRKGE